MTVVGTVKLGFPDQVQVTAFSMFLARDVTTPDGYALADDPYLYDWALGLRPYGNITPWTFPG